MCSSDLQGGADALSNLFGASAAFVAGPLMAVTSFAALGVAAAVVMIPVVLLVLRPGAWSAPPLVLEPADVREGAGRS